MFHGPVRVPDDAGFGDAKVTYRFDTWKQVEVSPTTIKLPVAKAAPSAGDGGK